MKTLKILFIQLGFHKDYPDVSKLATTYSDGIYYVASYVKREISNAQVDICQMLWDEDPSVFPIEHYDYIMVSALASQFWSNLPVLKLLKDRKKNTCKVIIGGQHATFAPYEALRYADYVILGEGEIPSVQLIRCLQQNGNISEVDNLCYFAEDQSLIMNDFVRYHAINNAIDPVFLKTAPRLHWATVSMSRGCPFDCSFCYGIRILGRKYRPKDPECIRQELDSIYQQTGCRRFYITDLNFTTKKDFCYAVASTVKEMNYHFIAMSRIEIADDVHFLKEMRSAGFYEYCLGVESDNANMLNAFNKRVNTNLQTDRLIAFAEQNIYIHSAIIFGLDYQDQNSIYKTARWCADARIMHPTFVCLAEYPFQKLLYGSRQNIEDFRIIMEVPTYQHYSFVGFYPQHMKPSVLQKSIVNSYKIFFDRALEIEKKPRQRMRLKAYAHSINYSIPGMEKHARYLEMIEKPYYTSSGRLKENILRSDFETRYGYIRERLARSLKRDTNFIKRFSQ